MQVSLCAYWWCLVRPPAMGRMVWLEEGRACDRAEETYPRLPVSPPSRTLSVLVRFNPTTYGYY